MRVMLAYARGLIEALVRKEPPRGFLPPAVANARVMGMAIQVIRSGEPRSEACRYALPAGDALVTDYSLGYLLNYLASSVAGGGRDALRLCPDELAYLGVTLTVFHEPCWVTKEAEDRIACVQPTVHGLVVSHPKGQSILLPDTQASMEQPEDAARLLDRVSTQAGLGPDAWRRDPQTRVLTFLTSRCESDPSLLELSGLNLSGSRVQRLMDQINTTAANGVQADVTGDDEVVHRIWPLFVGLGVRTNTNRFFWAGGKGRTLLGLAENIGVQLHRSQAGKVGAKLADARLAGAGQVVQLIAYWLPVALLPSDPHAQAHLSSAEALHLQSPQGSELVLGGSMTPSQIVAWRAGNLRVTSLSKRTYEIRQRVGPRRRPM